MKKYLLGLLLYFILSVNVCVASGGLTHMFMAREAIAKLPDENLRQLIINNIDAYLVGAYYPDSGYVKGTHYGEDSHWDTFIYAFADHINEKYTDPVLQNPKLIAFLFGCAAHRVSDEIIHWTFYHVTKEKDFHGDYEAAHNYGDIGIDLLVNIDKNQWAKHPSTWWVPVKDLVEIYHKKMGKKEYNAKEILWGNTVISMSGFSERFISVPAYPILKWKMPWTAEHYYNWPVGGLLMNVENIVQYQMILWKYLQHKNIELKFANNTENRAKHKEINHLDILAQDAIENGIVTITSRTLEDGSVELQPPVVHQMQQFQKLIAQYFSKYIR